MRAPTLLCGVALALAIVAVGCSYDYDTPFRCSNGVKDGDEVDTDCGGSCGPCGRGKHCAADANCAPAACIKNVCGFTPVGYWQRLTPTASPPGRYYAALAPASDGSLVLFGGYGGGMSLGDTWTFDGTTWTQHMGVGPSARTRAAMAYDETLGQTILVGGINQMATADVWAWSPMGWQPAGSVGQPRYAQVVAYDPGGPSLLMFGGAVDGFIGLNDVLIRPSQAGAAWAPPKVQSDMTPPARYDMAGGFDVARKKLVIFGGKNDGPTLGDTWEYDAASGAWTQDMSTTHPPSRDLMACAFDRERNALVIFGGYHSGPLGDTWERDAAGWRQVPPVDGKSPPTSRDGASMSYDAKNHRMILFGGTMGGSETWAYFVVATPCSTNTDCGSGYCANDVCCATPCPPDMGRCDDPNSPGRCVANP